MSNINEQEFVDLTKNKFGPTTGSGGGGGSVNFGPVGGGNNKFGPVTGGQKFGPINGGGNNNKFGPSTPPATANVFDCLKKDTTLKLSSDGKTMVFDSTSATGTTWTFYSDYKFTYKYKKDGDIDKGTWECDGTDAYKIKMEDGNSFDSKTGGWAEKASGQNAGGSSSSSSKPTLTDTSLTLDELKAGKEVSKGMRGPVVGEIQKLLIAAGYKNISKSGNVDNIFGSRTKASVEQFQEKNTLKVDGIVGDETIKALLSATPASSSSSSSEDPNRKPFDPNAEEDNSIPSTDGALIKEKKKVLQESLKKMLRKSLLKYS